MTINHVFYKNNLIAEINRAATEVKNQLLDELYAAGSDPVVYKRRFQMLKHLNVLQAQLVEKVYNFNTNNAADYLELRPVLMDIHLVTSRNA
jgi:hypothetical protein